MLKAALLRAAGERGVRLTDADAGALTRSWARCARSPTSRRMLAELRRRGYRLGVLTNVDDDLFEITHRGFATPFNLFVTAERVRGYKPEPWLFRAFERMTRVTRGRLGARGQQLGPRHRAGAGARRAAGVARSRRPAPRHAGRSRAPRRRRTSCSAIDQPFANAQLTLGLGSDPPARPGGLCPTPPRMPPCRTSIGFMAAAAGAGLAAQAGVNAQLRAATGSALWTALISASLTVVLLGAALVTRRDALATTRATRRYPWWIWTGGIAGAVYVLAVVALTRPLGVATLFAAIIVGQLSAGLVIDHFGWFNVPVHRASPDRLHRRGAARRRHGAHSLALTALEVEAWR